MSNFSSLQRDDFDGQGKLARDHGTVDLQSLLAELSLRWAKCDKEAADSAAGDTTDERPFHRTNSYGQRVLKAHYLPAAALTANDTNYATLRVRKRTAAGADGGIVAVVTTQTTGSGDWTAFVPVEIPLSTGVLDSVFDLGEGESLTFEILKAASGVIVPAGTLQVAYQ